jgi:ubiquitin
MVGKRADRNVPKLKYRAARLPTLQVYQTQKKKDQARIILLAPNIITAIVLD